MPYTVPPVNIGAGLASGISQAGNSMSQMFQTMGMMYAKDNIAGAQLKAFKAAGYFDDQPGKPGSAMIPSALMSAAQNGPLGTKSAMAGVIQNYLQMNYAMKMAMMKYGAQGGGYVGGGQGGPTPGQQAQAATSGNGGGTGGGFDLKNAPPSQGADGPWNKDSSDDSESE
jgi:hypothetical protein